jgi:16S rRNA (guanine966-N2)-methyltransferase
LSNPRIISGKARGTRLRMVPGDITRPITDVVKEALYNILGSDVIDMSFLDLFGGTGSVGIEALSRGASYCRFIDLNRTAVDTIKANLELTHFKDQAQVIQSDALAYLSRSPDRTFDYIYVAPPQYKGLWEQAMQRLDSRTGWFNPESQVIVQIDPIEYKALEMVNLKEFEQRKYGNTLLVFYEVVSSKNTTS